MRNLGGNSTVIWDQTAQSTKWQNTSSSFTKGLLAKALTSCKHNMADTINHILEPNGYKLVQCW